MLFLIEKGDLLNKKYIITDMLLEGTNATNFCIKFREGEDGQVFTFRYPYPNKWGLRVCFPLDMVDMNRWGIDREGAFLKPCYSCNRVKLKYVDRIHSI